MQISTVIACARENMDVMRAGYGDDRGCHGAQVFALRLRMIALALLILPAFALAQTSGVPKGNPEYRDMA